SGWRSNSQPPAAASTKLPCRSSKPCGSDPSRKVCSRQQNPMRVEAITLREIQMPLVHFFETSFGRTYSRRILLITAHCEGVSGWGECVTGEEPYYSSEWFDSSWATIEQYLAPPILGQSLPSARESAPLMGK